MPVIDVALYYPHVHPRDEGWLKQAVLFWPMIERIVPDGYTMSDSETGRVLEEEGILTQRHPGAAADVVGAPFAQFIQEHANELRERYSLHAAEELEPQPGWADAALDLRFGWVHSGKLAHEALDALCAVHLAKPAYEDWIGMHPALSDVYMCALAAELAAEGKNTPITDSALHHVAAEGWTVDDLARALLHDDDLAEGKAVEQEHTAEDYVVQLAVRSVAIRDLQNIPIERIVKLREDHSDDFQRFRMKVEELAAGVADLNTVSDSKALAHHIEVRYREAVDEPLKRLRDVLRKQRLDYVDAAVSLPVGATGLVASLLAGLTTAAPVTAAMTAIGAWKVGRAVRARRAAAAANSPVTWLLRIDQDLAPRDLLARFGSVIQRFAPLEARRASALSAPRSRGRGP